MAAPKLDLYREHKSEYVAPKKPVLVEVGPARYLAVEGQGAPGNEAFTVGVSALYGAAFTIKMTRKLAGLGDYKVCQLEGLWWSDRPGDFVGLPPELWRWKLLIRTPDFVTDSDLAAAVEQLIKKGKGAEVRRVTLESIHEGTCVQMLHVGAYADEGRTVDLMHRFAEEKGLTFHGPHHEIYLSDPRRVPPERLRTILRHPVGKK